MDLDQLVNNMKKRVNCFIQTSIDIEVDIPEYLIEEFEESEFFKDWERGEKNSEIYEILTDEICRNMDNLYWDEIEVVDSEDIIEE